METLTKEEIKTLLLRTDQDLLSEVIGWAFLSAQQYERQLSKGEATQSQYEAIENTKRVIKAMLSN